MSARVLVFVLVTLVFWLLVVLPARWLGGGDLAVIQGGTAALLCLIPGVVAMVLAELVKDQPNQQVTVALASTSLRMFFVLGATFLLAQAMPVYYGVVSFWIWVLVFYLFTLAVETFLLLVNRVSGRKA